MTQILVLDLDTLSFHRDRSHGTVAVTSALGETLAVVAVEERTGDREAIVAALDAAARSGRVTRRFDGTHRKLRLGFHNANTGAVETRASRRDSIYTAGHRVDIDHVGSVGCVNDDGDTLRIGDIELGRIDATLGNARRALTEMMAP